MIEDVLETATSTVLWNELVSSLPPAAAQENQSRGRPTPVAETPGVADAAASELDTETSIGLAFVPDAFLCSNLRVACVRFLGVFPLWTGPVNKYVVPRCRVAELAVNETTSTGDSLDVFLLPLYRPYLGRNYNTPWLEAHAST